MDMSLIQSASSGLQVAGNIARSLFELKLISEVQARVVELQSAIPAGRGDAFAAAGSALSGHEDQICGRSLSEISLFGVPL